MCDFFWPRMDNNNNQGDLADIVRATARSGPSTAADPAGFPPPAQVHEAEFGDPFAILGESPLLHKLPGPAFFDSPPAMREDIERPCNIFSRMLQISPGAAKASLPSPRAIKPSPIATEDMMKATSSSSAFQADHVDGLQISSPRTPGIKRRKSQAKKVVCVPAPAAAGSRASGEVVPSDLWAWRKYGQKPIKGSPYPRGYYRCSSSKGCSARKQVERSRTDPNMLVITYTSEHNHPWPTQRNALAGSTRSQLAKNSSSSSKSSPRTQRPPITMKEEAKETVSSSTPLVKQEDVQVGSHEFDQVFDQRYKPMIPDSNQSDDFFAELAELESDPMNLIFSKGFIGDKEDEERVPKPLDPFTMFDWPGNSFGEPKKSL